MDRIEPGYPTDLDDHQWAMISSFVPPAKPIGCERTTSMRAVIDAILYRRRSGCSWRMLPRDFPHWRTVYGYYRQWEKDGTWKRIREALCYCTRSRSLGSRAKPEDEAEILSNRCA